MSSPGEQKTFHKASRRGKFASSDWTRRWTCLLRGQHKHGRSTRPHNNKLHQTCRPVNQFEHVCVEKCALTTRHTVSRRSGDSCEESQRLSFGGSRPRRPKRGKPVHGSEPRSPRTQMLRADSCRVATWDDLWHKAGRGRKDHCGRSRETKQSKA